MHGGQQVVTIDATAMPKRGRAAHDRVPMAGLDPFESTSSRPNPGFAGSSLPASSLRLTRSRSTQRQDALARPPRSRDLRQPMRAFQIGMMHRSSTRLGVAHGRRLLLPSATQNPRPSYNSSSSIGTPPQAWPLQQACCVVGNTITIWHTAIWNCLRRRTL